MLPDASLQMWVTPVIQHQKSSSSGNRTPGVCVTGRNVTNYTNEERRLEAHRPAASGSTPEHPTQPGIDPREDAPSPGSTPDQPKSDTFSIFACHPCAGAMLIFSVSFQFLRMMPKHSDPMTTAVFTSGRRLPRSIIVMWRAQARLEKLLSGSGEHHRAGHWLKFSTSNQMASVYTSRAHLLPPVQERWSDSRLPLPTQRLPCIMAPKEGTTGIEPVTIGSAIQCSTAELCTHRLGPVTGSSPRRVETMKMHNGEPKPKVLFSSVYCNRTTYQCGPKHAPTGSAGC